METFVIVWSPEGRAIAEVQAKDAVSAKKKTPMPYRKYLGEVYVETKAEHQRRIDGFDG